MRGGGGRLPRKYRITIREIRKAERREEKGKYLAKKEREFRKMERKTIKRIKEKRKKGIRRIIRN